MAAEKKAQNSMIRIIDMSMSHLLRVLYCSHCNLTLQAKKTWYGYDYQRYTLLIPNKP